ncbi:MAG: GyrI-like domain-containing protein [Acidimicrobiales bacterium]
MRDQPSQAAAAIRAEVPMAELRSVFDRGFHAVMAAVSEQGLSITGPPFGFYPRMPDATVEVVVGFPVSGSVHPDGDVIPFELPGGRAVEAVHVGPYERLEETYRELTAWAASEGLPLAKRMWESYLSDPSVEPDPERLRTAITWPLA